MLVWNNILSVLFGMRALYQSPSGASDKAGAEGMARKLFSWYLRVGDATSHLDLLLLPGDSLASNFPTPSLTSFFSVVLDSSLTWFIRWEVEFHDFGTRNGVQTEQTACDAACKNS